MDIPNVRSSHAEPTPTGGGLSISLSILFFLMFAWWIDESIRHVVVGLGIGGSVVAIVGWLDDHKEISPIIRIILYFFASCWVVYWLGGYTSIKINNDVYDVGMAGNIISVIFITWLINLYNFMDGTDGLAATEAITVSILGLIYFWISGEYIAALLCAVILSSSSGFLIWNWYPAKIFMGDGGSCLLGITFGSIALYGDKNDKVSIFVWLVLLSIFISDSTYTLIKRMITGEKWYRAHNSHAYQKLVRMGFSHRQVAMGVFYINIFILSPASYLIFSGDGNILLIILTIYSILGICWFYIQNKIQLSI